MRHILIPLYAIIIFLLFWEFLVWINGWPNYKMASPSDIWPAFGNLISIFLLWLGHFMENRCRFIASCSFGCFFRNGNGFF